MVLFAAETPTARAGRAAFPAHKREKSELEQLDEAGDRKFGKVRSKLAHHAGGRLCNATLMSRCPPRTPPR